MGERTRSRSRFFESASPRTGEGRPEQPEPAFEDRPGAAREDSAGGSEPGGTSRKTHAIQRLPDGTLCIGEGCTIIRIPPSGDIQIDARDCPDDVADVIRERLDSGAGADFKLKQKRSQP